MQTFLPYPDFKRSAEALDYRRLGKQRVEAKQLLKALGEYPRMLMPLDERAKYDAHSSDKPRPWANHPATKMWANDIQALQDYHDAVIFEWVNRGYNNSMPLVGQSMPHDDPIRVPGWATPAFCRAHRSNLLRKDPEHYAFFLKDEPDLPSDLKYIWP